MTPRRLWRLSTVRPDAIIASMARKVKLRKREIVLAIGAGALATLAATGILSDGFGGPGSSFKEIPGLKAPAPGPDSRN